MPDPMNLFFVVDSLKSFGDACVDLEHAVAAHGFGVLAVHDLAETLRSKGLSFPESCRVFEVCNPQQAAKVLAADMSLNMALPCRISVYTEAGQTRIGMIRPEPMLSMLSQDPELLAVAKQQVEASTTEIIQAAVMMGPTTTSPS
jgi:uncharacterized protein (DUF302 family)